MKSLARALIILVTISASGSAQGATQAGTSSDIAAVKAQVAAAMAEYRAAILKGDAAAIAACYTTDGLHSGPGKRQGTAALTTSWIGWTRLYKWTVITIASEDLETKGDLAFEIGTWAQEFSTLATGVLTRQTYRYAIWWKRQADGKWKIHRLVFGQTNS